jgi:hypothetical protein
MKPLAAVTPATVQSIFGGKITPPPGSEWGANPVSGISTMIIFGIQTFLLIAAIAAMFFMLWGAFDWVTSSGDPDAIAKARQKITNAVIGLVLVLVALGVFVLVSTDVLKIIKRGPNGEWQFGIPTINRCQLTGAACNPANNAACCSGVCTAAGTCQ